MGWFISIILTVVVIFMSEPSVKPSDWKTATELCEKNSGITVMKAGAAITTNNRTVTVECENGAYFNHSYTVKP